MNSSSWPPYNEGFDPAKHLTDESKERIHLLRNKIFILRDTGIAPRIYHQWQKAGLVDQNVFFDKRKWITLSFGEYLWLKVIEDLKKIGCSVENILKAKKLCLTNSFDAAAEKFSDQSFKERIFSFLSENGIVKPEDISGLEKNLAETNVSLFQFMKKLVPQPLSSLEAMVLNILTTGSDASIVLFLSDRDLRNENVQPGAKVFVRKRNKMKSTIKVLFYTDEFEKMNFEISPKVLLKFPHIRIPLRNYITEFIADEKKQTFLEKLEIISPQELTLLKLLRKGDTKSAEVFLNDGKIMRIETETEMVRDSAVRLSETFTAHEYASIKYEVQDGKIVYFEKTVKFKPNKSTL